MENRIAAIRSALAAYFDTEQLAALDAMRAAPEDLSGLGNLPWDSRTEELLAAADYPDAPQEQAASAPNAGHRVLLPFLYIATGEIDTPLTNTSLLRRVAWLRATHNEPRAIVAGIALLMFVRALVTRSTLDDLTELRARVLEPCRRWAPLPYVVRDAAHPIAAGYRVSEPETEGSEPRYDLTAHLQDLFTLRSLQEIPGAPDTLDAMRALGYVVWTVRLIESVAQPARRHLRLDVARIRAEIAVAGGDDICQTICGILINLYQS